VPLFSFPLPSPHFCKYDPLFRASTSDFFLSPIGSLWGSFTGFPCASHSACLAYTLTLKMEAVCSSEMSVNVCWTTQHHTLRIHHCEDLKSLMLHSFSVCQWASLLMRNRQLYGEASW
jgi:hypothetical protein